jgi:tetratricopeptide (TPR) repeat protein
MSLENQSSEILDQANEIMNEAIEKAGELLCTRPAVAEIILRQLLKCDPEHLSGLQLLGLCKHRLGNNAEAVEIIRTALELDETNADNWNNLGLAYAGLQQYERAIEAINKAIHYKPAQFLFKNNLALQYRALGDYDNAVRAMREAIDAQEQPQLWLNLGGIFGEMRDSDNARRCFERALELDPEYPAAHVDMAFVHHLDGDWKKGFESYEWRFWYYPQMKFYLNSFDQSKKWDGKTDLNGKTVLVYGEQGLGDIIMFSRYAKELKTRGAKVIMHVPESLADLIARVDGVDGVNTRDIYADRGEKFPEYDYQFSLMSATHLLGIDRIDGKPYIKPVTESFRSYIQEDYGKTFNVGVVWAGNPSHPHDQRRSVHLKYFKSLQDVPGVKLFSLQMDMSKRQYGATIRNMNSKGGSVEDACSEKFVADKGFVDYCEGCEELRLVDLSKMIQSFEDTATILAGLDLVICCDTATAHLAGAMGKPVWVLIPYNPDWRWKLNGEMTEWYDSMKLFRQTDRDDWESVLKRIAGELHETVLSNQRQKLSEAETSGCE